MQLFVTVLTEGEYTTPILSKLADHGFHGSVLATQSIKNAGPFIKVGSLYYHILFSAYIF